MKDMNENTESEQAIEVEDIEKKSKKAEKLEKIQMEKIRGRIIIFNPEESEFAKHLNLSKKGDYAQKIK